MVLWGGCYLQSGRIDCQQRLTERTVKGKTRVNQEGNLTVEEYTHMGSPKGNQAIWTPSPVQGLTRDPGKLTLTLGLESDCSAQSDCRGCCRILNQGSLSGKLYWRRKKAIASPGEGEWRSKCDTGRSFLLITYYSTHGKKRLDSETVESRKSVQCRPARSSTDVYQRGTLGLVRQGDGIHYPVGQPLLGGSLPFLLSSIADKSCSELLKLRVRSTYMRNTIMGHRKAKAGSASSEGSACRFTAWWEAWARIQAGVSG